MEHTLINEDALIALKELPTESVDCIITDPPYNISQEGMDIKRSNLRLRTYRRESNLKRDFGEWDKRPENEYYEFTRQWFHECARILKPKGWFYSFFAIDRIGYFIDPRNGLFVTNGLKWRTTITWHKTNPAPSFIKVSYLTSTEFIAVGSKGTCRIPQFLDQRIMHNFFEGPNSSIYRETEHPTEKPVELVTWLLKAGSKENDVILDPFMGSGTVGVAAEMADRNFIGIEKDRKYFEIAQTRIDKARAISSSKLDRYGLVVEE